MKTSSFYFLSTLLLALPAIPAGAQVVQQVTVIKAADWVQTSASAPFIDPTPTGPGYGGPYSFGVRVSGTNLAGIAAPTVTLPAGSLFPVQNPMQYNSGILAYEASSQSWAFGIDANEYGTLTETDRESAFAAGTYGLNVNGTSFNLSLPAAGFPENTPVVTLAGGTWVRGAYFIDATQPLTITTNAFTNFNRNADGVLRLEIPEIISQLSFYSDNSSADNFISYTIPANTLTVGTTYPAVASFIAIMDKSTAIAGSFNASGHGQNTHFQIVAYSGPLPNATLRGIGDLPGGVVSSQVRDVTRVNGVLYAVGAGSANTGSTAPDTAVIWTTTGGLTPLRNLVNNVTATNFVTASAITRDAAYIASRARSVSPGGTRSAVRVATSDQSMVDFGSLVGSPNNAAVAISNDGSILYGVANNNAQAVRYTISGPAGTLIPFLNAGDNLSTPAGRGCSFDGLVMVGTSSNTTTGHNGAFRFVQGSGVSAIPYLTGGTANTALAISPDGHLTLVAGKSTSAPNGEFYLYNSTTAALTPLGTPNGNRSTIGSGGMTGDGLVVVAGMNGANGSASYVHNSHGWHNLQNVVAAAGVDLTGWALDPVAGMSPDGTLVWGTGTHNGSPEGFIVEFAGGFLASYAEPVPYSTPSPAIVGAWTVGDTTKPNAWSMLIFFGNGYYLHIQMNDTGDLGGTDGFERGQYSWNASTGQLITHTLLDTNGDIGLSGNDGATGTTVAIAGDTATLTGPDGIFTASRVTGSSPLVGAWGAADVADGAGAFVFLSNGYYVYAQDGDSTPAGDPSGHDGMEWGTYTWNAGTGAIVATPLVDTNGQWGLSNPQGIETLALSSDLLTLNGADASTSFSVPRTGSVAAPAIITSPANRTVAVGSAATFSIVASGSPTPLYQWQLSTDGGVSWTNLTNGGAYSGVSLSALAVTSNRSMNGYKFRALATNPLGSATSNPSVLSVISAVETSGPVLGDFDGDGKADFIWSNAATGERSMWLMNGSGIKAGATLGVVPVEWVVSATADFDGDGKADIFWTNTVTGDRAIWLMNGTVMRTNTFMGTVPTDWVISGTGDFDGDGKKDLVWTNTTTGDRAMWLMNGSAVSGGGYLGTVPIAWTISGVGDFDGDGKADLIWSNTVTGERSMWFQNGSTTIGGATLNTVPVAWVISGVGDFNGDGKADVFLTNTVNGDRVIWLMNGSSIATNAFMGSVPTDWVISGTGDFDGDGKKDVVWTNTVTGDRAMWLLNGSTVTGGGYLGTVPIEWKINN